MDLDEQNLKWLSDLNPEQRQAVVHGDGPLLIIAGAGSGKTRTLACRVAYLLSKGIDPAALLLLTFTRRAADEMLKRAEEMLQIAQKRSISPRNRIWGGTFHATANRLLRIYGESAGIDTNFTVMDQSDAEDLMNLLRHDLGYSKSNKRFPRKNTCLAIYSRCVNGQEPLENVLKKHYPWCIEWHDQLKLLFRNYVVEKQERAVLDYDDLLLYWEQLLNDKALAEQIGGRFEHILVDEYQDTNVVQAKILQGMRRNNSNITVVGDDAQSIYSFRAATVRNILDFPKQFAGTTMVSLEQNYRSVMPILSSTNLLISQAKEQYSKQLWSTRSEGKKPKLVLCKDENDQDEFVIQTVLKHYEEGVPLQRQAVLFRAGHMSDSLEVELTRRNIPYHKYGGLRFLESAHIKDVVAFLRILENPRDELAWFRVLQLLDGVGPATAAQITKHIAAHGRDPLALKTFKPPAAATHDLHALTQMFEHLLKLKAENPPAQIERIRKFYDPLLQRHYDNATVRTQDLLHLEQIAGGYRSRQKFLSDLMLDPPTSTSDLAGPPVKEEDWLILSTIHSAKGGEWDSVFLIHAADGFLPSDMATGSPEEIEEELRLTYVALTRAKNFLYVVRPQRYYHKLHRLTDRHTYAQWCRFLTKPDIASSFQPVQFKRTSQEDEDIAQPIKQHIDIKSRLRAMWE